MVVTEAVVIHHHTSLVLVVEYFAFFDQTILKYIKTNIVKIQSYANAPVLLWSLVVFFLIIINYTQFNTNIFLTLHSNVSTENTLEEDTKELL